MTLWIPRLGSNPFGELFAKMAELCGGFHCHGGYPSSWVVYQGNTIHISMDDLGIPPFMDPPPSWELLDIIHYMYYYDLKYVYNYYYMYIVFHMHYNYYIIHCPESMGISATGGDGTTH